MRARLHHALLVGLLARLTSALLCALTYATSGAAVSIPAVSSATRAFDSVAGVFLSSRDSPEQLKYLFTFSLMRISSRGTVTGSYLDNSLKSHGFVRDAKGAVTAFDAPGPPLDVATTPADINAAGTIVGNGYYGAFVRTSDGNLSTFMLPGGQVALASAINAGGAITGKYTTGVAFSDTVHGYVRTAQGAFETFEIPGAQSTVPSDINAEGTIIGSALIGQHSLGFVRSTDGAIATFDIVKATNGIFPVAINSAGTITGFYQDDQPRDHGFVRTRDGAITSFDVAPDGQTLAFDINSAGSIVGVFATDSGSAGFIRDPLGQLTKISVPWALHTSAHTINAAGTVAGVAGGHGFIRDSRGAITTFDAPAQAIPDESDPIKAERGHAPLATDSQTIHQRVAGNRATFAYSLPAESDASIGVYDVAGRRVADILDHVVQGAGSHEVSWSTVHVPRGVYFFRLTAGESIKTKTVVVLP